MKFENQELDKKTLDRLEDYGIFLSKNVPPVNKEKVLVLIGEAMLDRFVKEFVSLWKNELFPNCLLRDYEASAKEVYETIHPQKPWDERKARQEGKAEPAASCSNDCKEVVKMDQNTKEKLDSYLELLTEISRKTGNSEEARVLLQELSKDRRMQEIREEREMRNNRPATERQKRFMDDLGIQYPKAVTKEEASVLIDKELGKNNNE